MRTLQSRGGNADAGAELAPWFHNLHLPGGRQTAPDHPLGDFPACKWAQVEPCLPEDLDGARALDIGCNAGFYSFELARRGAEVLAIDIDEHYLRQARWAAGELGLAGAIELRQMGVYDLARLEERFDLILFLGVLYHLRHPLLALDLVAEHAAGTVVLQTLTAPGEEQLEAPAGPQVSPGFHSPIGFETPPDLPFEARAALREPGWPAMAFIEHELAGDPTNWWAPTGACVEAMLRTAGLEVSERPGHEIYLCRPRELTEWQRERLRSELRAATGRGEAR